MATPSFGDTDFLLGYCPGCAREVLTHVDVGPADEDIRRCVHCDAVIGDAMRWVASSELETTGYAIINARICGNGGGCSAGCGMRSRS